MQHFARQNKLCVALMVGSFIIGSAKADERYHIEHISSTESLTDLSPIDREFIDFNEVFNATEFAASKLALSQSSNPLVQKFASQLISDHQKIIKQLDAAILHSKVNISPSNPDMQIVDNLKKLKDAEFDRAYVGNIAVAGKHREVDLFEREASQGKNETLKAFATRMLPIIHSHLSLGERLIPVVREDRESPSDMKPPPLIVSTSAKRDTA